MRIDSYRDNIHPKAMLACQRQRRYLFLRWSVLTLAVGVLGCLLVVSCHPVPAKSAVLLPSSSDYCLAQTVIENAPSSGWLEQALIVQTSLNAATGSCSYNGGEHTHTFQHGLSVVQSIKSGDYQIAPALCAGATSFHREDEAAEFSNKTTPPCVAGGFVFVLPISQSVAAQ